MHEYIYLHTFDPQTSYNLTHIYTYPTSYTYIHTYIHTYINLHTYIHHELGEFRNDERHGRGVMTYAHSDDPATGAATAAGDRSMNTDDLLKASSYLGMYMRVCNV